MLFNSISFLIFFPIVVAGYYLLPHRFRTLWLLLASCYFYMAFVPKYILILFFLITIDYFLGIQLEKVANRKRLFFLIISIIANLGTLFIFKYFNFFNVNVAALAQFLHWNYSYSVLQIILPLGLSFHVFQSLSYVIEVYRKKFTAERNYLTYALYVMFFPQLVAGPIERPQHLLPQFKLEHNFDAHKARLGLERMLWGFFKKLVIADQIGLIVNFMFLHLPVDGPSLIVLAILFTYQIYCDFSGYCDIAIGAALVLGFDLTENFNRPFSSTSIAEFWRKWHITLSSWLRDYVYYPLTMGWGKISKTRLYLSLFITFVLIGLWHGANWTFVLFGAIHGIYIIIGSLSEKSRRKIAKLIGLIKFPKIQRAIKVVSVFILVSFANIFFRSETVGQAWYIISNLGDNLSKIFNYSYLRYQIFRGTGLSQGNFIIVIFFSIILMEIAQYYQSKNHTFYIFDNKSKWIRYAWYYALIVLILSFGYMGASTFIYFKF